MQAVPQNFPGDSLPHAFDSLGRRQAWNILILLKAHRGFSGTPMGTRDCLPDDGVPNGGRALERSSSAMPGSGRGDLPEKVLPEGCRRRG